MWLVALALRIHTAFIPQASFLAHSGLSTETSGLALLPRWLLLDLESLLVHLFVEVLIMIVPIKKFLEFLLVQKLHILLDLITVVVLPLAIGVVGIKVVFVGRDEWCRHPVIQQIVPFEVAQPRMVLHVFGSVESQAVQWLTLK